MHLFSSIKSVAFFASIGVLSAYVTCRTLHAWLQYHRLRRVKAKKLNCRNNIIDAFNTDPKYQLTEYEEKVMDKVIHSTPAQLIHEMTITRSLTSYTVVKIFCHQALKCHYAVNCLTEIMFDDALDRARIMDEYLHLEGKPYGLLHGLPISIKDTVSYAGFDSTIGLIKESFKPRDANSDTLDMLLAQGAIPFAKTNVPQTLLSFETVNPLWGRTLNPYNPQMTCGGSSGGEAALIALKGSVLGIGSDIAGSLRIPAHFCGVYTLKPSAGRLPSRGSNRYIHGQDSIIGMEGPMSSSMDGVILFMQAIEAETKKRLRASNGLFPAGVVPYASHDEDISKLLASRSNSRKLRVGYVLSDNFIEPSAGCRRAVLEAVEALNLEGHETFPFSMNNVKELVQIFFGILSADGGENLRRALRYEPIEPMFQRLLTTMVLRGTIGESLFNLLLWLKRDPAELRFILQHYCSKSTEEFWSLNAKKAKLIEQFHEEWLSYGAMDCLIYPGFPLPATPHEAFKDLSPIASYTLVWNVLDFSVGALPITQVKPSDSLSSSIKCEFLQNKFHQYYDPVATSGCPIGIQVVCPPHLPNRTLLCMKIIDDCVKKHLTI